MTMDPSQKAHEPLAPVKPADLIRSLKAQPEPAINPEAKQAIADNRAQAASELAMIFELKGGVAFNWFLEEFVTGPFRDASNALKSPHIKPEDLSAVKVKYDSLRPIVAGMIEREIAHRDQLDPNDQEVFKLRDRLAAL